MCLMKKKEKSLILRNNIINLSRIGLGNRMDQLDKQRKHGMVLIVTHGIMIIQDVAAMMKIETNYIYTHILNSHCRRK